MTRASQNRHDDATGMREVRYKAIMRSWIAASLVLSFAVGSAELFGCKKASTPVDDETGATPEGTVADLSGDGGGVMGEAGAGSGDPAGSGGAAGSGDKAGEKGGAGGDASGAQADKDKAAAQGASAQGDAAPGTAAAGTANVGEDGGAGGNAAGGSTAGAAGTGTTKDPNPTQGGTPSGVVDFLNVSTNGGTGGDVLMANLQKAKQRYRACYGKALASDPAAQGTLKLKLSIGVDGTVGNVSVLGGNLTPGPWVQCSVATTKSLKLPPATPATSGSFDIKYSK